MRFRTRPDGRSFVLDYDGEFAVLRERGAREVATEIDDENVASRALLVPLGARRTGGSIELVRRAASPGRG